MSGSQQAVLLDSTAYFRLGISIDALLAQAFGTAPVYSLYVLSNLDDEYRTSNRLQHKFGWVQQRNYADDRAGKRFTVSTKLSPDIDRAFSFLADYADSEQLNVSLEDLKALAVGFAAHMPVVTDDRNMAKIADAHQIECWSTIKLLKVMVSAGRIDLEKVTEILEYWEYEKDLPMAVVQVRRIYREYFNSDCPI